MTLLYCFDNFYYDPDAVREYALSLEYESLENSGIFPGSRTDNLHKIDQDFFHQSSSKLFGMFTDDNLDWCVKMTFQKIWNYSDDKESNLNKGWIHKDDPRGWFEWYCKYYLGRSHEDDQRQIKRWLAFCGPNGRWRNMIYNKIQLAGCDVDCSMQVSKRIQQSLLHWSYVVNDEDYQIWKEKK